MRLVLFACVHNAGRSKLAAAWFRELADPRRARALSAGTQPAAVVHPEVLRILSEEGLADAVDPPQRLTPDLAATADLLVTMGCGEECPVVPGLEREDWPIADPKGRSHGEVQAISRQVRTRVLELVKRMGVARPGSVNPP